MTLEQAKPLITEELKEKKGTEKLHARVEEVRKALLDATTAGKPFAEAAKEQGLTVMTLPPFRLNEPPRDQEDLQEISMSSLNLPVGGISQREDVAGGALLVHVKQREAANADLWETEKASKLNQLHQALKDQTL